MLERYFSLRENGTTVVRELLAGLTTFLTMSYILVVQPSVLCTDYAGNPTGMDSGGVLLATALSSAFATLLMGCYARLPFALAPGMGQNFFFVSVIMSLGAAGVGAPWQTALGIVFIAGVLFLVATLIGLRQLILDVMSPSLRSAIAVGIGLFIAFIGLKNGGLVGDAESLVALNAKAIWSVDSLVFWIGLLMALMLTAARIPGGILIGVIAAAVTAWACQAITISQVFGLPQIAESTAFRVDIPSALTSSGLIYIAMFLFMDVFDTTGTLVGVSQQAGLLDAEGNVPRVRQAMIADSVGTLAGAVMGTSTVTTYIESAAGVEVGGRTGLTAVTTAMLFLAALLVSPLVIAIGGYPPITAGALVVVGAMMFSGVQNVDWSDPTESIPSFLVIAGVPLFFSIADGIALGLIVWPILKIASGRLREVTSVSVVLSLALILFFLNIRLAV